MRKIDSKYENPLDDLNIAVAEHLSPCFHKMGFTANGITTLSMIFGILSIFLLWKGYIWGFAITFYISYWFDCMDGYYARRYNNVSKFGDLYDHIKDVVVMVGVLVVFYLRNRGCGWKTWLPIGIGLGILFLTLSSYLGCQEKIYPKEDESGTLNYAKKLCPGDPKKTIQVMKWLGTGTTVIIIIILIVWVEKSGKCK
jgi:phosphatidylglycerophosphate synthase